MNEHAEPVDANLPFDSFSFDEDARHPCQTPSQPEPLIAPCPERPRTPRCDQADRELLRNHFPIER